ncbi:MAG: GNAT family N-acetyltransferase [Clostridia bacterium]|nr:GNAT family N-acetyltransferase [Clostridia bacterium]
MIEEDIKNLIPLYIEYYNGYENAEWTEKTTYKRVHQVLSREDSYCVVWEDDDGIVAFAIGYFEQYDDGFAYDLVEIVVVTHLQNKGYGTVFMRQLESYVKKEGAMLVQLQAVNDDLHNHFYSKLGYKDASNLVLKTKIL